MKILHYYTDKVLFEDESLNMGTALEAAINANTDLCVVQIYVIKTFGG